MATGPGTTADGRVGPGRAGPGDAERPGTSGAGAALPGVNLRKRGAPVVSTSERAFVAEAVRQELRVDGRGLFDLRRVTLTFGSEDGTVEADLGGQTRVLAAVSAELAEPFPDRPNEGSLAVFAEVSPLAHEGGGGGSGGEEAVELARIVDRSLRESHAADMEALCVVAGSLVWAVRLELHVLDHGGNLVDAASLAALAALMSFRYPVVTVSEEEEDKGRVIVHPPEERDPQPLILHMLPLTCTFAFFNDGNDVVLDPSAVEESAMGGRFSVAVSSHEGDVCALQKPGGIPVSASQLLRCVRIAASKAPELEQMLRSKVAELDASRTARKVKRWKQPQGKEAALPGTTAPPGEAAGLASGEGETRLAMLVETEQGQ